MGFFTVLYRESQRPVVYQPKNCLIGIRPDHLYYKFMDLLPAMTTIPRIKELKAKDL